MNRICQVAIVGGSAAGKGTLAAALVRALPGRVARVELDAFYRDLAGLPPVRRARQNFDHPTAVDWPLVRAVFDRLQAGQAAEVPVYDFCRHERRRQARRIRPAPVVIWDGLWLLDWSWMRRRFALGIFVACAPGVCLQRRLQRDVWERGRSPDSVHRQYRTHVLPLQRRFVEPQRLWADLVIRSPWSRRDLRLLVGEIRSLLAVQPRAGGRFRPRRAAGSRPAGCQSPW